jgi:hypothetical protein
MGVVLGAHLGHVPPDNHGYEGIGTDRWIAALTLAIPGDQDHSTDHFDFTRQLSKASMWHSSSSFVR